MAWWALFLFVVGIGVTVGGPCLCCGCEYCQEAPGTLQATLSEIENDGCTTAGACEVVNGTYPLTLDQRDAGTLPDSILTPADTEAPVCYYTGFLPDVTCLTADCDVCHNAECEPFFNDATIDSPYVSLEECESLCNPNPSRSPDDQYPPGPGEYSMPENQPPECDACEATTANPFCSVGDVLEDGGACQCVATGFGAWDCVCEGECSYEADCGPLDLGQIEVFIYRSSSGQVVAYTLVRTPEGGDYHGETIFEPDEDGKIDCVAEFGPLTQDLEEFVGQAHGQCTVPTSIELEFV